MTPRALAACPPSHLPSALAGMTGPVEFDLAALQAAPAFRTRLELDPHFIVLQIEKRTALEAQKTARFIIAFKALMGRGSSEYFEIYNNESRMVRNPAMTIEAFAKAIHQCDIATLTLMTPPAGLAEPRINIHAEDRSAKGGIGMMMLSIPYSPDSLQKVNQLLAKIFGLESKRLTYIATN